MLRHIEKIWNYDFQQARLDQYRKVQVLGVAVAALATGGLVTVLGGFSRPAQTLLNAATGKVVLFGGALNGYYAFALLGLIALAVMVPVGYAVWVAAFGPRREEWTPVVWANALTNLVDLAATYLVSLAIGAAIVAFHLAGQGEGGQKALGRAIRRSAGFIAGNVPTILEVPAPFSVVTWFLASGLVLYALHRLAHTSRLFWLLVHRAHHAPSVLTGLTPPVSVIAILSHVPLMAILFAVVLKMFPSQASVTAIFIVLAVQATGDIFSHQTVLYGAAFRNPVFRQFFHLTSNGPYHYVHHSSKPGEQMINLDSWGPFLLWDRIFGTYRAPTQDQPHVGLTNNPRIRLSPFVILFGGYQQLAFELRMNKDWRTRARIVFGSVKYRPPITKDFLILEYPEAHPASEAGRVAA